MSEAIGETDLREGYKKVQIGPKSFEIPEEWGVAAIPDLCNLDTESFDASDHSRETFEYIDIESVSRGTIDRSKTIPVEDAPSRAKHIVDAGDTLVSKVRPYLQAFAPVTEEHDGKTCSSGFAVLSAKEGVHSPYITQAVLSKYFLDQMTNRMTGTSYPAVNKSDFENVQLFAPPLPEQRRIADILSTVDEQIQQTDKIIEETKALKGGLMQDIFNLDIIEHSSKQTTSISLEEVPEKSLGDYVTVVSGAHVKSEKVSDNDTETPYLTGPADFDQYGFTVTKYTEEPTKFCEPGDTLVTVKGSGCGKTAFANDRASISRQLKVLRANDDLDEYYLYYWMQTRQELLEILAQGTSIPGLSTSDLTTLRIPVPSTQTQTQIGKILSSTDEKIRQESQHKQKLQELKRGLMQDLLTGKVRTPPDLGDGAATSDT